MTKRNVLSVILLGLFVASCVDKTKENENLFSFNTAAFKEILYARRNRHFGNPECAKENHRQHHLLCERREGGFEKRR